MVSGKKKLQYIEYDLFVEFPKIFHGTFLRHGGMSVDNFSSLNVSDGIGDHPDSVMVNRELIKKTANVDDLIFLKQVHGVNIVEITKENLKKNSKNFEADAMFTKVKNIGLAIAHADCQAAIIYDLQNEIIAVVHAGWKGLIDNIYVKVIERLKEVGSKVENLYVAISPSLGKDHSEFKNYKKEFPKEFWGFQIENCYFDLLEMARVQLKNSGIKDKHMEISNICTFCNGEDFYSYRRDKITGRHATLIALK